MPAPAWENLDDFLSVDDFAIVATFTRQGSGQVRQVRGIFDEQYVDADLGEYTMDTGEPRLTCKEADVVGLKKHDACTIAGIPGVNYELSHDPVPDGTGTAVVRLERVFE